MNRHLIISVAVALAAASASAADNTLPAAPAPLTLEQCVATAVANNRAVAIADNDLAAAGETSREAFTKYFPEISAEASWFKAHKDIFRYNVLDLFTIGLIDGGKMAGVQLVQPVFMGGRIVNGNRLAGVGREAARIRRDLAVDNISLATEQYYWNLATLRATRSTVTAAIAMLDSLTRQVNVAVDAGVAMKNDLLKVRLKRNQFEADLVDVDNGIRLVTMLLAQSMGVDTAAVVIDAAVPDSVPAYPTALRVASADALPATNDYRLLEQNVAAKALERRITIGSYLPSVAVGAGWFYHDVLGQNNNFGALSVMVTVPISGWWGGSHAIRRKNLELENARLEMADLSRKLEIEMQDKWDDLTAAHRKMQIAHEAIAQADENLRLNRAYYDAGMSTVTDLLDAETSRKEAMTAYVTAYGAFCVARAAYLNATGRGMAHSSISDDPSISSTTFSR